MDIKEKKKNRFLFLKKAYELTNGNKNIPVFGDQLGKELDFSREETQDIFYYLMDEYLIKGYGAGLTFLITHSGIKEVEEALENPDNSTEHFLPVNNIINIGTLLARMFRRIIRDC